MRDKEKNKNKQPDINEPNEEKRVKSEQEENQEKESSNGENLQEKVEGLELELTAFRDKFLRKAAEFENYKRRTENDQMNLIKYGGENFIRRILPVVDDFERSLQHIDKASDPNAIKEGIKLVYDKFMKILNEQGVKKIEAVGKEFDVHYHEAMLQKKAEDVKPHTVLEEIEKGYLYNDKVIRHSKVVVSEDTGGDEANENDNSVDLTNGENKE